MIKIHIINKLFGREREKCFSKIDFVNVQRKNLINRGASAKLNVCLKIRFSITFYWKIQSDIFVNFENYGASTFNSLVRTLIKFQEIVIFVFVNFLRKSSVLCKI